MRSKVRSTLRVALIAAMVPALIGAQDMRANFDERVLASHNRERAALGLEPLTWDMELAEGARGWANYLARTGRFEHAPVIAGAPKVGENIWGGTVGAYNPEAMVGLWVAEKQNFKPGVFPANSVTGNVADVSHYTQVVWRETGQVGCAASVGQKEEILVCRYSSHGNVRGSKPF